MAVKLAAGVKLVDEGDDGRPSARLLILNQTTTNGWVEHIHIDLQPAEALALGMSLIAKAGQLKEIRESAQNQDSRGLFQMPPGTWDGVPGSEEDQIRKARP